MYIVEPTSATPSSSVLSTEPSTSGIVELFDSLQATRVPYKMIPILDDSGSGSTELSTHDVTEISVASSSGTVLVDC